MFAFSFGLLLGIALLFFVANVCLLWHDEREARKAVREWAAEGLRGRIE